MNENDPNDENGFVDDRARQESLITDPDVVSRPETESRIDRGGSDDFADDRTETEESEDAGEQSALTGDNNQKTLADDRKGPEWF